MYFCSLKKIRRVATTHDVTKLSHTNTGSAPKPEARNTSRPESADSPPDCAMTSCALSGALAESGRTGSANGPKGPKGPCGEAGAPNCPLSGCPLSRDRGDGEGCAASESDEGIEETPGTQEQKAEMWLGRPET